MAKIYLMHGLPGSGKSTVAARMLAENPQLRRVSRDDLRFMFAGNWEHNPWIEQAVTAACKAASVELVRAGYDVLLDECNANPYVPLGEGDSAEDVFVYATVEEAVARDAARERSVGRAVIERMAKRYPHIVKAEEA